VKANEDISRTFDVKALVQVQHFSQFRYVYTDMNSYGDNAYFLFEGED
jgi:hypothetical protein